MLTRWTDLDRTFAMMDEFQRRVNRMFEDYEGYRRPGMSFARRETWPPLNMYDRGEDLEIHALVPGISEKDLNVTVNQEVVTLSGERRVSIPEGYSVHRQERGNVRFSRSFTLPCKCDLEKVSATVKNGVLTLKMAKAPEAQPRQITVTAK